MDRERDSRSRGRLIEGYAPPRESTLPQLILGRARITPRATAIRHGGGTVTFGQLEERSRRVAQGLAELGVGPGERVALWLPNVPAWLILCLACARLGAIAVAVNTRFRSAEVGDIVGRSGARVLACWPGFKEIDFLAILGAVDAAALARLETVILYDESGAGAAPEAVLDRRTVRYRALEARPPHGGDHAAPGTPLAVFTTSGTTRAPKFVLHGHAGIVDHARQVAADFGFDARDAVILQALPLCGVFGFSQAMAALAAGRPMVLLSSFDAAEAAALVRDQRVTHMNGSDEMFRRMLAARSEDRPFPSLRLCGFAAFNPAIDDLVGAAEGRGLRLVGLYGMSEIQALFARQKVEAEAGVRGRAGGFPVAPEARVRVRDLQSGALLGHGEDGELELAGPSRMAGYLDDAEATAAALSEDGYVRSGDLGHTLADGSFVFRARMGDVLRLGGFLVSPAEIEGRLLDHPEIDGAQVVGVAGAEGMLRTVAFVIPRPGGRFDEQALRAWCARGLAKYKVPARFIALDAFPTTESANGSKIQRARLRQMAAAALA